MSANRITVQIMGGDDDFGDVRFEDFIRQLELTRKMLMETERMISEGPRVCYRVVDLRHSSPSTIVLEAVGENAPGIIGAAYDTLIGLQERGEAPQNLDYDGMMAFKAFGELVGKSLTALSVSRNGAMTSVTTDLPKKIDRILGPDEFSSGSFTGMIHQISLHGSPMSFRLYPTWNGRYLHCAFRQELREQAVGAVDQYVTAYGRLHYKRMYDHPIAMDVENIEILPGEANLPRLEDMRGIDPDATGGKSSEEFIRELRNEWR